MNHELAKKLKDSGFPQNINPDLPDYTTVEIKGGERYKVPTLSELIEACGGANDFSLERIKDTWFAKKDWVSEPFKVEDKKVNYSNIAVSVIPKSGEGRTPEEAVANLWLSLNKK